MDLKIPWRKAERITRTMLATTRLEVDSSLTFQRQLETVAHRTFLRVTLLRRVRHLLDADGLLRLYKAQVRPIMEYSPLAWISSAQGHLTLLDKVQRRAERLIQQVRDQQQSQFHHQGQRQQRRRQRQQQWRQQQQPLQQHQQQHDTPGPAGHLDSLEHWRRVSALTVLHKAQLQHTPQLTALRVTWRRYQHITRTVVSSDLLLDVPRTHTASCQRAFTWATAKLWNAFTVDVPVQAMSNQQVKAAAHSWCRTHPP